MITNLQPGQELVETPGRLTDSVRQLQDEIRTLYLEDNSPWILGYSGGKDSTATLQLVWSAIAELPAEVRTKLIHVISTDTLVENPIVAAWVSRSLEVMRVAAVSQAIPIQPHRLTPTVSDSFWVNLIGKGYPAPRHKFRWCTERLKIKPSNTFINSIVSMSGEAILVLGTRKAESSKRHATMKKHEKLRVRDRLSPNASLPGSLVYSPIEAWSNDDVWLYLMQSENPWGYDNKALLGMYAGASADGECPLVVDSSTPSCGDSRFGCWVCTLVEQDKSMSAMIRNDEEKEWMMPLLDLRNALDFRSEDPNNNQTDRHLRDFRRMNGNVQLMAGGRPIPGPYKQAARTEWLRKLLNAEAYIRKNGPDEVRDLRLISKDELQEIRRIWVIDKHEIEDCLPSIYQESTGELFFEGPIDDGQALGAEAVEELEKICGGDRLHFELVRELLSQTVQQQASLRRAGVFDRIEGTVSKHFYIDEHDAIERAQKYSPREKAFASRIAPVTTGDLFSELEDTTGE